MNIYLIISRCKYIYNHGDSLSSFWFPSSPSNENFKIIPVLWIGNLCDQDNAFVQNLIKICFNNNWIHFSSLNFPQKILDNKKCWEFYLQDFRRLNILKKDKNLNFWFLSIEQSYQVINSDWWNKNETKIDDFISFFFSIIYKSNKNINKTLIANKL